MHDAHNDTLERLSPDEQAYLDTLLVRRRDVEVALSAFTAHLGAKYGLGERDQLRDDGLILRGASDGPATPPLA